MLKSKPYLQKFFSFTKIDSDTLTFTIKYIAEEYFENPKISLIFSTKEESYSDLKFDDFEFLLDDNIDEADIANINITEGEKNVSIVFQFQNDLIGPNGNYTISLNDKTDNKIVEDFLWKDLELIIYNSFNKKGSDKMLIEPVFVGREFDLIKNTCFVLMPFSENWSDRIWRHIKSIVESNGFVCTRADDLYGTNILDDIWKAINESEIIIADTTTRNPNVFYEIGISHTLGKKVILLSQSKKDIPFDFLHYRHIIYEDNTDGIDYLESELPKYLFK